MSRPKRALGYARVSSTEQALGTSLYDQQQSIKAYAKARGVSVARMYVEAQSAIHEKLESREQVLALMADVRAGDLVLCAKVDRWSRDPEFSYSSIKKIIAMGASFYAIDDHCDPSTNEGDTMLNFRVLFAREEHKRIKERMVGTRQLLRERGYYVEGTPPFGYRRSKPAGTKGLEKNILEIDPEPAALVRRMFRMVVAGKSLTKICTALNLGRKRVWSSIHCRSYLGEVRTTMGWVRGMHPAIIDASLFAKANELISARRNGGHRPRSTPSRTDTWILRDVAHCALCGSRMRAAYGKNPDRDHYYGCRAMCRSQGARVTTGSYVTVRPIEALFEPMVLARLTELREEIAKGSEPSAPRIVDFDARRERLLAKRQRYLDQHADDLITLTAARASITKVDAQLLAVAAEEANQPRRLDPQARREMLREISSLEKAWRRATPQMKRQLVNVLVDRVGLAAKQPPVAVWRTKEVISKGIYE